MQEQAAASKRAAKPETAEERQRRVRQEAIQALRTAQKTPGETGDTSKLRSGKDDGHRTTARASGGSESDEEGALALAQPRKGAKKQGAAAGAPKHVELVTAVRTAAAPEADTARHPGAAASTPSMQPKASPLESPPPEAPAKATPSGRAEVAVHAQGTNAAGKAKKRQQHSTQVARSKERPPAANKPKKHKKSCAVDTTCLSCTLTPCWRQMCSRLARLRAEWSGTPRANGSLHATTPTQPSGVHPVNMVYQRPLMTYQPVQATCGTEDATAIAGAPCTQCEE